MTKEDYTRFDYILAMEEYNLKGIDRIIGKDKENKVYRLLDFTDNPRDIVDPWYTGNFNITYMNIKEGIEAFLEYLKEKGEI